VLKKRSFSFFLCFFLFIGCTAPPIPPEARLVEEQERSLWRLEANRFVPQEFEIYSQSVKKVKEDIIKEESKFIWFRNYQSIKNELRKILNLGEEIKKKVILERLDNLNNHLGVFKNRIEKLKEFTLKINEGRLARRDLIKAELEISEATGLCRNGDYEAAERKLSKIASLISEAEEILLPVVNRYSNENLISKWRKWAKETIYFSKNNETSAIIINKSERNLTIYKNGKPIRTYSVGLGSYGSRDKLFAGDGATPEGKYWIIKKLDRSYYHKALLINYPNEEDRREFLRAKKMGHIPSTAKIGGLIEIHGGGRDSMTYGCISLDNPDMDEVFDLVSVGTPVTIIGAISKENVIARGWLDRELYDKK
jgi:lipoprotein-anchoring transpeptidase ErfK/SrfK